MADSKLLIHLSDIHYRIGWEENQGKVINAFWIDLEKQIHTYNLDDIYIVFSGDIVQAGGDNQLYENFHELFNKRLNNLGIKKNNRICVPGNHDISVSYIKDKDLEHSSLVNSKPDERKFNDYINSKPDLLFKKFDNYIEFQKKFASFGLSESEMSGKGFLISENISIFCLNTAICSSGGFQEISDYGKLCINTRSLNQWISDNKDMCKILIMHHPIDWLCDWAKTELKSILNNNFVLSLSGHIHNQSIYHIINKDLHFIECSAPPLFTDKKDDLGYTLIEIKDWQIHSIKYRQWSKRNSFVPGVNFTETEDGIEIISTKECPEMVFNEQNWILNILEERLENALRTYSSQPIVWAERVLSEDDEISRDLKEDRKESDIYLDDFIRNAKSAIVRAPAQFGLTCLSLYLTKRAWELNNHHWLYFDLNHLKLHTIDLAITSELKKFNIELNNVKCVIIDSWKNYDKNTIKIIKKIKSIFIDIPIIIMQTMGEAQFLSDNEQETYDFDVEILYLLALSRKSVRHVVSVYNDKKNIGEENIVVNKVVSDLDVLNIHRTPLNCFTLLTASEKNFDENPVNRTMLLEKVLFLLFDTDNLPTYKSKPDVKDCEYILGQFCQEMIKSNNFYFYRENFIYKLKKICIDKLIEVDIELLFDILYGNNIITNYGNEYSFRYSYWLYYFAARSMHHDKDFAQYILSDKKYVNFPEIIEFYTGIDRNRNDALEILTKDINDTLNIVKEKVYLPDDLNPYKYLNWNPDETSLEKVYAEISKPIQNSNLPDDIKDQFADEGYRPSKPYNQQIRNILDEYSVLILMQDITSACRALRNSDYVSPEIKKELLNGITRSWFQLTKVLFALTPALAINGHAAIEGAGFMLCGGKFNENSLEERMMHIFTVVPYNIIRWYKDDLFSNKLGPLLFDQLKNEENEIIKHQLALVILYERPKSWKSMIHYYISNISKNSFYLFNLLYTMEIEYRYAFATPEDIKDMRYLLKAGIAKHEFGTKSPGADAVKKISDKFIPNRESDDSLE